MVGDFLHFVFDVDHVSWVPHRAFSGPTSQLQLVYMYVNHACHFCCKHILHRIPGEKMCNVGGQLCGLVCFRNGIYLICYPSGAPSILAEHYWWEQPVEGGGAEVYDDLKRW